MVAEAFILFLVLAEGEEPVEAQTQREVLAEQEIARLQIREAAEAVVEVRPAQEQEVREGRAVLLCVI